MTLCKLIKVICYKKYIETYSDFRSSLRQLIDEPKYKKNVEKTSALLNDNIVPSLDTAVYWCEYLIRHEGAPHLQPASKSLYWFQEIMLDIIVFILTLIFLSLYLVLSVFRCVVNCVCRSPKKGRSKSKRE